MNWGMKGRLQKNLIFFFCQYLLLIVAKMKLGQNTLIKESFNLEDTVSDPPANPPLHWHYPLTLGHPGTPTPPLGGEQHPTSLPLRHEDSPTPPLQDQTPFHPIPSIRHSDNSPTLRIRRADVATRVSPPAVHPQAHHHAPPNYSSDSGFIGNKLTTLNWVPGHWPAHLCHKTAILHSFNPNSSGSRPSGHTWRSASPPLHLGAPLEQLLQVGGGWSQSWYVFFHDVLQFVQTSLHLCTPLDSCSRVEDLSEDQQHCCVDSVNVDFAALGWHFVLSPPTLEFTYCRHVTSTAHKVPYTY